MPFPVTTDVTSYSIGLPPVLHVIAPRVVTWLSRGGWLSQVSPVSVQASEVVQMVPPGPPLVQFRRTRAEKTGPLKPWTENLRKPRWMVGLLSTFILVLVPKLDVGN